MCGAAHTRYSFRMASLPQPRERRGLALLLAHCAALDEERVPARERLEAAVGPELARTLVLALSTPEGRGERPCAA